MSVASIITLVDTQIEALLADVNNITSYKLGNKSVSKTEALRALTELRKTYQDLADKEPFEDIRHVAYDVSELGVKTEELVGDSS